MTQISYLSVLRLIGADVRSYLHRQLSAEIEGLAVGETTFACLCQPKGRVIALLLVQATPDGAWVLCARALAETVAKRLGMSVFRDDVRIETMAELAAWGIRPEERETTDLAPLTDLTYRVNAAGDALDREAEAAWHAYELQCGVAWLDQDSSEKFLPQMLGYEAIGALNFRKGCFPGQEIIARTRYLGKLKQHALLIETSTPMMPAPMTAIELSDGAGMARAVVVDAAPNGRSSRLLLAVRASLDFRPKTARIEDADVKVDFRWLHETGD